MLPTMSVEPCVIRVAGKADLVQNFSLPAFEDRHIRSCRPCRDKLQPTGRFNGQAAGKRHLLTVAQRSRCTLPKDAGSPCQQKNERRK